MLIKPFPVQGDICHIKLADNVAPYKPANPRSLGRIPLLADKSIKHYFTGNQSDLETHCPHTTSEPTMYEFICLLDVTDT